MLSAYPPEVNDSTCKSESAIFEKFVFDVEGSAGDVCVVVNDRDDLDDHVLLTAFT